MSNIFTNVDQMDTGAKLFFVAIGLLIMLAYSLESQPAAQQTPQPATTASTPAAPSPATAPPASAPPAAPRTANRPTTTKVPTATKAVAVNSDRASAEAVTPGTTAVAPATESRTATATPAIAVPERTANGIASDTETTAKVSRNEPPPGYFTVGSTKEEVMRAQGSPAKGMSDYRWAYGLSSVEFRNGRVAGWNVSPLNPMKAVLIPEDRGDAAAARTRGFFTVGSTKDEVIGAQGTPTHFSDVHWTYGLSSVEFSGGAVTGWNDSPLNPLRARLLPAVPADSVAAKIRGYFTVGSTRDEVLGVQGTPSRFSDTHWTYGLSSVQFQNGRVTTWNSSPLNPLRAALGPENADDMAAARARGYFAEGSTKDEVLGVQGTPSSFSDTHWAYGLSSVSFQNGRVAAWKSSPLNPLKARKLP
jgi:hypothetical protein